PGDLVYLPKEGETSIDYNAIDRTRIYKMVSGSGTDWYFIPNSSANVIEDRKEYGSLNKLARALTGEMIKDICLPISIDRLGNLIIPQQP
ncbi:MAG: hypothetical protein MR293_05935, partial [Bacteroidales bacterium]|nr:hypothetical protein [Bacteroidales bacterium]